MSDPEAIAASNRFSLKSLFLIIAVFSLFIGLFRWIGMAAIPVESIFFAGLAGVAAHQARRSEAFWRLIASAVILLFLPLANPEKDVVNLYVEEIVIASVLLALGGSLALSSLRKGHWATQFLAVALCILWAVAYYQVLTRQTLDFRGIIGNRWW